MFFLNCMLEHLEKQSLKLVHEESHKLQVKQVYLHWDVFRSPAGIHFHAVTVTRERPRKKKNNMSIRNQALPEIIGSSKHNFVTCNINDLSTLVTRSQPVKDFTDRFITHLGKFADRWVQTFARQRLLHCADSTEAKLFLCCKCKMKNPTSIIA